MAMSIGSADAEDGMAKAIFAPMDQLLSPPLQTAVDNATGAAKAVAQQALNNARTNWKQLAFAIATGVINHITQNMEIVDIQTTGDVAAVFTGITGPAPPGPHTHPITLTAAESSVTFTQSGSSLGHAK
jgi:hypothetical protein